MNRREIIQQIAILTGASVLGADRFLRGGWNQALSANLFSPADIAFFDEVAETIIPRTATPGAKDAKVGAFIADYATQCYSKEDQGLLKQGIEAINKASTATYKNAFLELNAQQRQDLISELALDAQKKAREQTDQSLAYFTHLHQLTMLGFFTSEPGATKVLRYVPVPGKYEGCISYKKGEKAWSKG
jgi:hypothetical protein